MFFDHSYKLLFTGNAETIETNVKINRNLDEVFENVQIVKHIQEHIQEISSLSPGNRLNVKTIYETLEAMSESRKLSLTGSLMFAFGKCIENSFKNGYAREYLDQLHSSLNAKNKHVCRGQVKIIDFYLKCKRTRLHPSASLSTSSCSVETRSSNKDTDPPSSSEAPCDLFVDEKQRTSLDKTSKRKHYAQDVRIPDFVVHEFPSGYHAPCIMVFEVKSKSTSSETIEGISQILSYGLAQRCHRKSKKETLLVLITPKYWIYGILPPFGEKLRNPFLLKNVYVFDTAEEGGKDLVIENYIYMLKLFSRFIC
ncbi:MAG: hypothetical protein AAF617_17130 [Bacteroidota bacterium]